jgi:hypothetical protein
MKPELYVSTDIETDGGIAGINNMLSFGSVVYDQDGNDLKLDYYATLELVPEFQPDPATMKWWSEQDPTAWKATRDNAERPGIVMPAYREWLESLPGTPIFVGSPACWDFSFVFYYLKRWAEGSPFLHRGLDIRSFGMGALGGTYGQNNCARKIYKKILKEIKRDYNGVLNPLPHHALHDAREQGELFVKLLRMSRERIANVAAASVLLSQASAI